jgi:hypothetical protein
LDGLIRMIFSCWDVSESAFSVFNSTPQQEFHKTITGNPCHAGPKR